MLQNFTDWRDLRPALETRPLKHVIHYVSGKTTAFLESDAFVRTNRRAIAIMFLSLSIHLSVWDGRAV